MQVDSDPKEEELALAFQYFQRGLYILMANQLQIDDKLKLKNNIKCQWWSTLNSQIRFKSFAIYHKAEVFLNSSPSCKIV